MKIISKQTKKILESEELIEGLTKDKNKRSGQQFQDEIEGQISIVPENEIRFESLDYIDIPEGTIVKIEETSMGMIVTYVLNRNTTLEDNIKKISNDKYIFLPTFEIREYESSDFKSKAAIRKSMNRLKKTICTNFNGDTNCVFLTLTEDKEHASPFIQVIKESVSKFFRNLKYRYRNVYDLAYVAKFEQQQNGSWHAHCLIKDVDNKDIVFDKEYLEKHWKCGYPYIQKVMKGKRYAPNKEITSSIVNITNYMAKKTQLADVPRDTRLFIKSNNIETPKASNIPIQEIDTDELSMVSENAFAVYQGDKLLNIVKQTVYSKKSPKQKHK